MLTLVAVLAAVAVFASAAFAGNSSSANTTYSSRGTNVQQTVSKPKAPTGQGTTSSGGTLPFTGLDLAFIAGGGLLLVGMGVSLRRLTRKHPTA